MKTIAPCIFIFVLLSSGLDLMGQHECGSGQLHTFKMANDSVYAKAYEERQLQINQLTGAWAKLNEAAIIPVVVHVFHLGEPEGVGSNISDAQIMGALNGLNERYANLNGLGVDAEIQFCLATRSPEGCPTTGIIRIDASSAPGYSSGGIDYPDDVDCGGLPDEDLKALSTWPVSDYYNIWVVHTICEGWAGYAYYPWGANVDGTVIADDYMTSWGTTLTHELGHGFNLPHTFEGDGGNANCPLNDDCFTQGDYSCDTPPHKQGDCGGSNPCTTEGAWDNSRFNFMSYCGSTNRFTQNQKERMQASLLVYPRVTLLSSQGCTLSDFETIFSVSQISCAGQCNATIMAHPDCPGNYSLLWNTGDTTETITGLCPGIYSVVISDENGQTASFETELTEPDVFEMDVTESYEVCSGDCTELEASGAETYTWSPGFGLSDSTDANPLACPDTDMLYNVIGISDLGCTDIAEVNVIVHPIPLAEIVGSNDTLFAQPPGFAYQWYDEGGLIDGETGPYIVVQDDGNFSVLVTDEFGCESQSDEFPFVGLSEMHVENEINIYPNPGSGSFTISFSNQEKGIYHVEVFDCTGRIIHRTQHVISGNNSTIPLHLDQVSDGIYYVRLKHNAKEYNDAIIQVN